MVLGLAAGAGDARTEVGTTAAPQTRILRVATGNIPPFVLKEGNTLTGFSVDLWQEIARRLKLEVDWVYVVTRTGQLQAVARGDADVAISAIVMTSEGEEMVDFSIGEPPRQPSCSARARSAGKPGVLRPPAGSPSHPGRG